MHTEAYGASMPGIARAGGNSPSAAALDVLQGEAEAGRLLNRLRQGTASGDELMCMCAEAIGCGNSVKARAFFNALQRAMGASA